MRDSIGNCSDDSRTVLATEDNFRSARMAVIAITACLRLTTLSVKESEDGKMAQKVRAEIKTGPG